ncbi:MAG: glycine--tRNA ligase [Patescibacteria group bacterium]
MKAENNKKGESVESDNVMEKLVSLCKRRGFVYQGSEIYGGLAGTFDYGPLGVALKKNIENLWWKFFVDSREDMYGIDSAILMNPKVWEASGHVGGFHDPLVADTKTKKRFRADHLLEAAGVNPSGMTLEQMGEKIKELKIKSPDGNALSAPQQFNMMFKTSVGSVDGADTTVYLRPETAQGMFVNFKNIVDSFHPKLPFGIAQVGRNFRNEIAPRDFIFRVRELEIMEFEYFLKESDWQEKFQYWQGQMHLWFEALGFSKDDIREVEIPDGERAHYSKRTVDFHFRYPHKFDEIGGLAYRTDFDLKNHITHSGEDLSFLDPMTNEKSVPHVLEPTFGLGRHLLAVLSKAYTEDELGGEKRVYLKLPPHLAPIKIAVFPLLKNKPMLVEKAREVFSMLKKEFGAVSFDDNGNIGKRYRRQDEIGTPFCITVDFDTIEKDNTVTVRDRDSGNQERVKISELLNFLKEKINN